MRFKALSSSLHKKVDNLSKICKSKTTLPILNYIKVDVADDVVKMTASDLEITLSATVVPEEVNSVGSICVLADKFAEIVKSFKDQTIDFSVNGNNMILKAKGGTFKIPCFPSEDFPILREPEETSCIVMSSHVLVNGLNKTDFATYKDEDRPAMRGVNISFKVDKTEFYATDGVKIASCFSSGLVSFPSSAIVPLKLSSTLKSLLSEAVSDAEISFDDKNIKVDATEYLIYCKKIEAQYPAYEATLNREVDVIFSVGKEDLLDALKRSLSFANTYSLIAFNVLVGRISLAAENQDYGLSAEEELVCENKEGSGFFKVNGRYLLEILQRISSETIEISFSEKQPIVYLNPLDETENCLFGLMKFQ